MNVERLSIEHIPAVIYGDPAQTVWLYLHGQHGCKEEAEAFARVARHKSCQVLSIDLPAHGERAHREELFAPWFALPDLQRLLAYAQRRWPHISLRCNSLGAWFSLLAFGGEKLEKALFVSPVLDMEALIFRMMGWAGVSEEKLRQQGEIPTDFGQTLSWRYLEYVRAHPVVQWNTPTSILYAAGDDLVDSVCVEQFSKQFGCELTVAAHCEHWFHTAEQLEILERWEQDRLE